MTPRLTNSASTLSQESRWLPMPAPPASACCGWIPKTATAGKSSWPAKRAGFPGVMEAAGIEPASADAPGERLQAYSAIESRPTAGGGRPTGGPAILWCRAPGDWLSLGAEPVIWRRYPSHGPSSERRRYLTTLGGECEIWLRTCFCLPVDLR